MPGKIPLKENIIYGPVDSRRLGRSLGINLTPPGKKICSFDCVYCQYGETEVKSRTYDPLKAPSPKKVRESLEGALKELDKDPSYITFSGNGEATLHPEFGKVVEEVKEIRDGYSDAEVALLSNSSKVDGRETLEAISEVDVPIMKLDVGSPEKFKKINRPLQIEFRELIGGLKKIENLHLQSLKFRGEVGNSGKDVHKWVGVVSEINPKLVQIYTLDRPSPFNLKKTKVERLEEMKDMLNKKGIKSEVY